MLYDDCIVFHHPSLLRCPIALLIKPSWYFIPSYHCIAFPSALHLSACHRIYRQPVPVSICCLFKCVAYPWCVRLLPRPRYWPPAGCAPRRGPAVTAVSALDTGRHLHNQRPEPRSHGGENQRILCCKWCIVCRNNGQISMNNQRNGSYILFISYYLLQLFLDM